MNPNLSWIVLRPRGPLEVFDLAWRFLRETWRPQLRMLALVWLAPALVAFPLCALADGHPAVLLFPMLLAPWLQAPFTLLTGRLLFERDAGVLDVLRELASRLGTLLVGQALAFAGWVGAAACGFLGLVPVRMALQFLPEVLLLERLRPSRAVRRTLRLAGARSGAAFTSLVARAGLVIWCGAVGEAGGQALFRVVLQLGEPFGTLQGGSVTPFLVAGLLLSQPLHAVYRLLLYVDVRTRTEGWDLQVALRAAGLAS